MNGSLNVRSEELKGLAGRVQNSADNFNASLDKVINYNTELKSNWQGSDIDSYSSTVATQAEEMKKFYNTLIEISNFMKKTAMDYENAQETNKSMIHGS